jgi:crotonobetainyl-CoA:carnitine CoA-transferase CaiB-like acyl-CoA transferase
MPTVGLLSVTSSSTGEMAKAGDSLGDLGARMWGAIGVPAALARVRAGLGGVHTFWSPSFPVLRWAPAG